MLLVATSAALGLFLTQAQVPQTLARQITEFTTNPLVVLALRQPIVIRADPLDMRAQQIDELLKEQWLKTSDMSAYEYEKIEDRLVVVHELTPPDMLLMHLDVDDDPDEDDEEDEPEESALRRIAENDEDPRRAFRTAQQMLPAEARFEHFATIDGDIAGDLWLRPDGY